MNVDRLEEHGLGNTVGESPAYRASYYRHTRQVLRDLGREIASDYAATGRVASVSDYIETRRLGSRIVNTLAGRVDSGRFARCPVCGGYVGICLGRPDHSLVVAGICNECGRL